VIGWKDEAYLDDLRDKTRRGLAGQARRGFSAGGKTFGYRTEPVPDPTRTDPHGIPKTLGYRRTIRAGEAAVVHCIFSLYASGWSTKKIARLLNREKVPAPRSKHGWTWTAIYGNPTLKTAILNNPLYIGQVIWNKFQWEKDPETGKRIPRVRPREEWIIQTDESLRIIPQDVCERAKERQKSSAKNHEAQSHPKYLFSGLLVCGICGAKFIMRDKGFYTCSFHHNRGPEICSNSLTVKREFAERVLIKAIRQLFAPRAIAYLSKQVNEALKGEIRRRQIPQEDRRQLEADLQVALAELDNIRTAIKRGLSGNLTRELISQAEAKVRGLTDRLATPSRAHTKALTVLPEVIQRRLQAL
jgi:site-specific DNA recombinase